MLRLNYEKRDLGYSFGMVVAVMVAMSFVLNFIFGQDPQGWRFWLMQGLYTLFIGSSAIIYAAVTKTNLIAATKLNVKPRLAHLGWGFLAVGCLIFFSMPLNSMVLDAIEAMGLKRPQVDIPSDIAGLIVVAAILPALCEEIIFRGTVAQSAKNMHGKVAALAVSGALFAVFHINPAQTLHQFVLGAFLTLLVFRSGSLWTSIAVHLFNNVLVVALDYTPLASNEFWNVKTNTGAVLGIMFAGLVAFSLCVFGYIKTTKSDWQPSDEKEKTDSLSLVVLIASVAVCVALWIMQLFV